MYDQYVKFTLWSHHEPSYAAYRRSSAKLLRTGTDTHRHRWRFSSLTINTIVININGELGAIGLYPLRMLTKVRLYISPINGIGRFVADELS